MLERRTLNLNEIDAYIRRLESEADNRLGVSNRNIDLSKWYRKSINKKSHIKGDY